MKSPPSRPVCPKGLRWESRRAGSDRFGRHPAERHRPWMHLGTRNCNMRVAYSGYLPRRPQGKASPSAITTRSAATMCSS
jgi:hypothetical protein